MSKIGLISCVSRKQDRVAEARDLYISPLFVKARQYAEDRLDSYFILSAKYGLLNPLEKINPYDLTLKTLSKRERSAWAEKAFVKLGRFLSPQDKVVFLAGATYREFLSDRLVANGTSVASPLYGMSIGEQLQWYSNYIGKKEIVRDLDRFYSIIRRLDHGLGSRFRLGEMNGRYAWPERGVYFFFEDDEYRKTEPFEHRVVRVGTHAVSLRSRAKLWTRLRTHRGRANLNGNHRSSIFRSHVGNALIARNQVRCDTWGVRDVARNLRLGERDIETKVSEIIGRMKVLWITIADDPGPRSDRAYIERNCIALLSCSVRKTDTASKHWLGNHSPHDSVVSSSLWNVDHVKANYDPRFLDVLDRYVGIMLAEEPDPGVSIAPSDWVR